jgi:outer membrane protein TolC
MKPNVMHSTTIRSYYTVFLFLLAVPMVSAQLTLDQCQEWTRTNYPTIKQLNLIDQSAQYTLSNIRKAYLPQLSLTAKATYQSDAIDVTLPIPAPVGPLSLHQSKDQYQAVAEINQLIWDGGVLNVQKKNIQAGAEVDKQKVEVELYTLRERVSQLFFSLLLLKEQDVQLDQLQQELQANLNRLQAALKNGVVSSTDLELLQVEILGVQQKRTELRASQKAYRLMLSALLGREVKESTLLVRPLIASMTTTEGVRPELKLYDAQVKVLDSQLKMESTNRMPKLGFFVQGGFGRPGLNMLSDQFAPFYIGGVRVSLNLSTLYTQKNTRAGVQSSKAMVETSKETFLLNNALKTQQYRVEIEKTNDLIQTDNAILQLRTSIKNACNAKWINGVSTLTDLLREITAENAALQQKSMHEIQLLMQLDNLNHQNIP